MLFPSVNLIAVLIAAITHLIISYVWYSPAVMGKPWMKLMGLTDKTLKQARVRMSSLYGVQFVGALVQAAVISTLLKMTYVHGLANAMILGGILWLGLVAVTQLTSEILDSRPLNGHLLAINTAFQLVSILGMTVVLFLLS